MATRILIVEDDEAMRDLILEHLSRDPGFAVVAATADGNQALPLALLHRPDIVLMDLSLPGLNGLKATKLIHKACPGTKVIILSNYELGDLRDRVRESPEMLQSSAFVSKREIPTRLREVIKSCSKGEASRSS